MQLRSGRRLRRSPPLQSTDLISSLPDEMLLLILARLRCVRAAVQTGLLSRRWRGLCTGLTDLTFRNLEPARIEAILAAHFAASTPAVSTLDIRLEARYTADLAGSLLRAAARVSPRELVFTSSFNRCEWGDIKLPCFNRTASIELQSRVLSIDVAPPFAGEFTSLERLSLAGYIINLGVLLSRCPRLRVLSLNSPGRYDMSITLPPNSVFPTLDSLSLTGEIDGIGNLLNLCQCLRVLSVTYPNSQQLTLPPAAEFRALEKLSLSGNIANPGTLLNRCPCLRLLTVTFYGMSLASLKMALATIGEAAPVGLTLSRLSISIPWRDSIDAPCFASLLHMAASQSPQELIVTDNFDGCDWNMRCARRINAHLPCFRHATSIEMDLQIICFTSLSTTEEFLALERLTLLGCCSTIDVGTLVTRCPRLRVLEINLARVNVTVHSSLLQKLKLYMDNHMECHDIDIVTPMLKQLQMVILGADMDTRVSISAPVLEKVKWQREYTESHLAFGSWRLRDMSVETIENNGIDNGEHVLRLHLYALNHLDREFNFAQEMEKIPVTKLSVLKLYFGWACHVYGALVLRLLRMHQIRAATKKLEVFLDTTQKTRKGCHGNSPCHKPKNWRSQSVFYTCLEEVEIIGFTGEDHEHDFLTMIFKCSPMLKKVTVTLEETIRGRTTKLSNIFSAYPFVNCNGHYSSGELFPHASG